MASPQIENGYTRVANEILEHLAMPGISGSELRIVIFVLRKTYGFGKKTDYISLSQFQKGTLMTRSHVTRTIKELVHKRVLLKDKSVYGINKNWESWLVHKRVPSTQTYTGVVHKRGTKVVHKRVPTKETKETNTKDNSGETPQEVPFVFEEYIKKLEDSPRRDLNIIALYLEKRRPNILNVKQMRTAVNRHLRPAKELIPFTNNQIIDAIPIARRLSEGWTLETLIKVLTK